MDISTTPGPYIYGIWNTIESIIVSGRLKFLSVLAEARVNTARECQHILSWPASSTLPYLASIHFTNDEVRH